MSCEKAYKDGRALVLDVASIKSIFVIKKHDR